MVTLTILNSPFVSRKNLWKNWRKKICLTFSKKSFSKYQNLVSNKQIFGVNKIKFLL